MNNTKENLLRTNYKELYKELSNVDDYLFLDARNVSADSKLPVWWRCSTCGHKYPMSPYSRVNHYLRNKTACLFCAGENK